MVAAVMLAGIVSTAYAMNDERGSIERTPAYCPACGAPLWYDRYTVTSNVSGDPKVCYVEISYEQPMCYSHGKVYGAQELSRHEYYHSWGTDYTTGNIKCGRCGMLYVLDDESAECPEPYTGHTWFTDFRNGYPECSACGKYAVKTPRGEDLVCPNHSNFHSWITDEDTGLPVCETCGLKIGIEG